MGIFNKLIHLKNYPIPSADHITCTAFLRTVKTGFGLPLMEMAWPYNIPMGKKKYLEKKMAYRMGIFIRLPKTRIITYGLAQLQMAFIPTMKKHFITTT